MPLDDGNDSSCRNSWGMLSACPYASVSFDQSELDSTSTLSPNELEPTGGQLRRAQPPHA